MSGEAADLLYQGSTGLEKALAVTDGDRITAIPAEIIRDIWDPNKIPVDLLPYLAWAFGVQYWNDDWSETTKRAWVESQLLFKSMRGTAGGLRMAVDYAGRNVSRWGYTVELITTRPQKIFSGPSLTRAEREDWLSRMPQIRVWRIQEQGEAPINKAFYGAEGNLRLRNWRFCLHPARERRFTSPEIVVSSPIIDVPEMGVFWKALFEIEPLEIGVPALTTSYDFVATNLTVASPSIPRRNIRVPFETTGLVVGSPALGTPVLG